MKRGRHIPRRWWIAAALTIGLSRALCAAEGAAGEGGPPDARELERHLLVTLAEAPRRPLPPVGSTPRAYGGARGYKSSARARRLARRLAKRHGLTRIDGWPIESLDVYCVVYEVAADRSIDEALSRLTADPLVESVQRMGVFRVLAERHNDPLLELQHGFSALELEEAHRWSRGDGVEVAVVDTGIDVTHPEFSSRVVSTENFVGDAGAPLADVHGTAVAGVIAAAADNGIGIAGVAPAVRLLALRACWPEGRDTAAALCSSFTLAKALSYVVEHRPDVVNLSLAGPPDPLLARLLARAVERGVLVVSAMPERALHEPRFPATADRVIAVGTGVGKETDTHSSDALAALPASVLRAPGDRILTTMPAGGYDFLSGSSLAAAHVTGLIALLLEQERRLSYERVVELLRTSDPARRSAVNGCRALQLLSARVECREADGTGPTATGAR